MGYGISAWFDHDTEQRVRVLWSRIADQGIFRDFTDGPFRPHVTLGVYESLAVTEFRSALARPLSELPRFAIRFPGIGFFPGDSLVAYLTITPSSSLETLYRTVHSVATGFGRNLHSNHLPDHWNPHSSLGLNLAVSSAQSLLDFLSFEPFPIVGTVDRVGIIDTPAEIEVGTVYLANQ